MNREELLQELLSSEATNFILELPTGYGKTKCSLEKVKQWYKKNSNILIVIPRLINIKEWEKEIKKWDFNWMMPNITFTTYISLPKKCGSNYKWDVVIFDEGHHTSERCQDALKYANIKHVIILSATLKREHIYFFNSKYNPKHIKVKVKDAIDNDVLPDPKIILIPITFDNSIVNQVIEKNTKKNKITSVRTIGYAEKWKYKGYKGPLRILCTQQQYYNEISGLIDWYKQKGMYNSIMKNLWFHKAGERLKWLAEQKEELIKNLLSQLKNYRTLVFCPSIEDSAKLGSPCINSKVGTNNLDRFNNKKIKHIAAVGMLDEGANLVDCKIGIFQMINSSDRLNIQRQGRLLRHKSPILIFPYFKNSREQEIVDTVISGYNPELIIRLENYTSINNIKEYI